MNRLAFVTVSRVAFQAISGSRRYVDRDESSLCTLLLSLINPLSFCILPNNIIGFIKFEIIFKKLPQSYIIQTTY